ncbi:MAG: hypothetical protein VB111_02495 [Clostridiaceae bacterium]|nr:hypothetical protein [Clostridiaceae bacterium]
MLEQELASRALLPILTMDDGRPATPALWTERRRELRRALETYSYGVTPPAPDRVTGEIVEEDGIAFAGKVIEQRIRISFDTPSGEFSFPLALFVPQTVDKPPVFLHIAFRRDLPDRYVPIEEITDAGFALAVFCYKDVVNDNLHGDYSDGLARAFGTDCARGRTEWGKIGMWAYGASRALDYLLTRDDIDAAHTAVIGHSRLGKTALWTAAQDERFWCAISNDSGYGGAATSKHGEGERVRDFLRAGSWDWYCENFKDYVDDLEDKKPYDQSFLLALLAPRLLCVGSAVLDQGADPKSEFLTSLWASQAWTLLDAPGLVCPDRLPVPGDHFREGNIGYHLRSFRHFLSREDWNHYIGFLKDKLR